ncbi:hypothetical protein BOTBODRAFT_51930 [Botryobasidium botryosum FD-172 SS1]|uniref:Integrase catalytic domain-containing protein n=1 Tax=Botryobasidium botryosum (strain FD-172 SS1) TaxID=930990 RepID=A0A067N714_BOTB1|nr:hypothetical protein BOTBODRAFT_51930 [Botryobasidium botryosum FD-172 SS1]
MPRRSRASLVPDEELERELTILQEYIDDYPGGASQARATPISQRRRRSTRKVNPNDPNDPILAGPHEQWAIGGTTKLEDPLGLSVHGIIDKWSQRILAILVLPPSSGDYAPELLYTRLVKQLGGIPLQVTTPDKASSGMGYVPLMQEVLREEHFSELTCAMRPPHALQKPHARTIWRSVSRSLEDLLAHRERGLADGTIDLDNEIHTALETWVWAKAAQSDLDEFIQLHALARIGKKKSSPLPSGGLPKDFYDLPELFGGENQLIPVDAASVPEITAPQLFRFGSEDMDGLAAALYAAVSAPEIRPLTASDILKDMIALMDARMEEL